MAFSTLDIFAVLIFVAMAEPYILQRNYRIFSPISMLVISIGSLYVFPFWLHFNTSASNEKFASLSSGQIESAIWNVRCFTYTYAASTLFLATRLTRVRARELDEREVLSIRRILPCFIAFSAGWKLFAFGCTVGFNPATVLQRIISPRDFTTSDSGFGPILYIDKILQFLSLTFAIVHLQRNPRAPKRWVLAFLSVLLVLAGGRKAAAVSVIIVSTVVYQKNMTWIPAWKKLTRLGAIFIAMITLLALSFSLHYSKEGRVGIRESVVNMGTYQQEAYFLPLVMEHYPWNISYPIRIVSDTAFNPIPRVFWPGKPYGGSWFRYFGPDLARGSLETGTVATTGCLAEAHMMFGQAGPFVYGVLWATFTYFAYHVLLIGRSLFSIYAVSFLTFYTYLLCRTGFLDTTFWGMTITLVFGAVICRMLGLRKYAW